MSAIKAAIIGCGRIAWQLEHDPLRYKPCTHLGAICYWLKRDKNLSLAALCDHDRTKARDAAAFAGAERAMITGDYREIIRAKPKLLVIATNTASHVEILTAAIKAKIPRIIIEKPVAFSTRETATLKRVIHSSKSIVLPNYERRYHPKYSGLKEKLADAKSYRGFFAAGGKSLYANSKSGDEGVLLHDTTHLLDLVQFFFGAIKKQESIQKPRHHLLYLEHTNGSSGIIETKLGAGVFHLELEIRTPKERVVVGNGFLSVEKIKTSPHYRSYRSYDKPLYQKDKAFPVAANPFVRLYEAALYGRPDNSHFFEALDNVAILAPARET